MCNSVLHLLPYMPYRNLYVLLSTFYVLPMCYPKPVVTGNTLLV
ncbi:hypothetical protein VPH234P10_0027 [Vibrio phage 234P10]